MKQKHSSWGPLGKDVIYLQILWIEDFDDYRVIVNIDKYDYFFKKKVKVCLNVFMKTRMCPVHFRKLSV